MAKLVASQDHLGYKRCPEPLRIPGSSNPMSVAAKVSPEIETPKPQKTWFAAAVGLLILILVLELIVPARRQSSSFDEGMHTFAGYSYWARGDFGLNPEHPPLVKLLAALPLLRDHVTYPNLPPIFLSFHAPWEQASSCTPITTRIRCSFGPEWQRLRSRSLPRSLCLRLHMKCSEQQSDCSRSFFLYSSRT